jgi:hypothetical protein
MSETIDPPRAAAALMETLASTFADIAFIDVAPARGAWQGNKIAALVRAAIDVLRPVSCRLEIECPFSLKERIEATLFRGQGEGRGAEDSLLEILNVAAGVFLTSYFGPGADIKIELPHYLYFTDGSEGEVLAEAAGDAEGEPLRAVLRSVRYRY